MSKDLTITVWGPRKTARLLRLGDIWQRQTSKRVVAELELEEGSSLPLAVIDAAIDEVELTIAKTHAFEMLSRRSYPQHELEERLTQEGYPQAVVEAVLERLIDLGYIDDTLYARSFIEAKTASGWGKRKIIDTLKRKYVSQDHIDDALESGGFSGFDPEEQLLLALQVLGKRACDTQKDYDKLLRRLVSRGFSIDCARSAIERHKVRIS